MHKRLTNNFDDANSNSKKSTIFYDYDATENDMDMT